MAFFPAAVADGRALDADQPWQKEAESDSDGGEQERHLHVFGQEVEIWRGGEITQLGPGGRLK